MASAGVDGKARELSPEEMQRRQRQREMRRMALELREQGKAYEPVKRARKQAANQAQQKQSKRPKTFIHEPADFQVAIIPIFWNQRPAEKQLVLTRCGEAAALLNRGDISSYIDHASHLTPGQRMRRWEERGVKVRLELGPRDAEQYMCILARSQAQAGLVAHKQAGSLDSSLVRDVAALLSMPDHEVPEGDYSKYIKQQDVQGREDRQSSPATATFAGAGSTPEKAVKSAGVSGDALGDDFAEVEVDDDVVALSEEELAVKKRREERAMAKLKKRKARERSRVG